MSRSFLFASLVLLTASTLPAQITNLDDLTPLDIGYRLRVQDDGRGLEVDMSIDRLSRSHLNVAMPNWSPGAYRFHDAGKQVRNFEARHAESGESLPVMQLDHATWSIATNGCRCVEIHYELPAQDRATRRFTPRIPRDATPPGIHFQGPLVYMYVQGAKNRPVTCRYELPDGWEVANGMIETDDPMVRWAKDYDTFIDCPTIIGRFRTTEFKVDGTPVACVWWDMTEAYEFDMLAATEVVRTIVEEQASVFGSLPFFKYWFLYTISPTGGGGGLEHLNSTSIGLSARGLRASPESLAGITAHEFFHTWNVKRIRPIALGPFEYEQQNYTGNLWVSEGWTSYYGDLSMLRSGLLSRENYLRNMARTIQSELSKPRRKEHSVYWASRNVWHRLPDEASLGARVDYYGKGELLAWLIDLEIRRVTNGTKSLDDVMRFMNRWFAERGVGFEENDVERACTAISNHDFGPFFARHVRGTIDPPLAEILAGAGLAYRRVEHPSGLPFRVRSGDSDELLVSFLQRNARDLGLKRGDRIVAIDGQDDFDLDRIL
ncbi:MAG: M61 family metallopeptidase, partial [Planctomycetes bacterium]|nr:M61 family metallopeptidase [Planctomycetota bacterium]